MQPQRFVDKTGYLRPELTCFFISGIISHFAQILAQNKYKNVEIQLEKKCAHQEMVCPNTYFSMQRKSYITKMYSLCTLTVTDPGVDRRRLVGHVIQ